PSALTDQRDRLSRKNRKRYILHRPNLPTFGVERDGQSANIQQSLSHSKASPGQKPRSFGSSASRSASPTRLYAKTVRKIAKPGNTAIHQTNAPPTPSA